MLEIIPLSIWSPVMTFLLVLADRDSEPWGLLGKNNWMAEFSFPPKLGRIMSLL